MGRMSSNTSPGELSMTPSTASFDSQSSYSSCESQDSTEGRAKTHSLTPTRAAIANAAPQPAQGAASNLTERRKLRVDSARSQRSHSERWILQKQLEETGQRAGEAEQKICELTRHFDLQNSALERQLKKEIRRRTEAENENEKHKGEIREIKEKLTEKEKQLNYSNIYIQRQNKRTKKQNSSSSLALPAPESKE